MKQILLLVMMLLVLISTTSAESLYGIYEEDEQEIVSGTFGDSDVTHLRDNYYGVVYTDGSNQGQLQVIEVDEDYQVINSSVDTWQFNSIGYYPKIINMNNETGLSVIAYRETSGIYNQYVKSFDVYPNGSINTRDSSFIDTVAYAGSVDIFKTDNTHFIVGGVMSDYTSRMVMRNYAISSSGTLTGESNYQYCIDNRDYGTYSNLGIIKSNNMCLTFYKEKISGEGFVRSLTCTNTSVSGGSSSLPSCSTESSYGTNFEDNEVYYMDADVDTEGGFIYVSYAETLSKYPVLMVRDGSDNSLLDKERINTDTATSINVKTLSSNNVLVTYSTSTGLVYKTFSISGSGEISEVYSKDTFATGGTEPAVNTIYNSSNRYITSYTGSSGDVLTFGTGLIPPPEPEDTSLTIKDEKTLEELDFTDLNLTFYAYCDENTAYSTDINSTTTSIPVTCDYESFGIKVNYQNYLNVTESYTRYYVRDLTDTYGQFDLDVYLINPYTTDFVTTQIIVDDLRNIYTNAQVLFEKNIDGVTTQITAFDLDLENKMRAVLMTDEIYYAYINSDETSKELLGKYISAPAGTVVDYKVFYLYDIQMQPNYNNLEHEFNYMIYNDDYNIEYSAQTITGAQENLINLSINIYNGTDNTDTLIYNDTLGGEYDPDSLYTILSGETNLSDYVNDSAYAEMTIWFSKDSTPYQKQYNVQLWDEDNKLILPLTEYVDQDFLNWFILILLSVIALYASIETANMAALAIIGIAALFVVFGWFGLSMGTLAFAIMISLISLLVKKGEVNE